jgi:SsrA-binding protein
MSKDKARFSNTVNIKNKKARFNFELIENFETGIVLKGSEIKSIREGKASLQEAYCHVNKGEIFIKGMNISPYTESTYDNHDPIRERKLLLRKKQIEKIKEKMEQKGLTLIPVRLYITSRGFAKLDIALAKGKKVHDKRDSIKQKDQNRELQRLKL